MKNQTGLEYLIENILFENESYIDEEGDYINEPLARYVNSFKSHINLSGYVAEARRIDKEPKEIVYSEQEVFNLLMDFFLEKDRKYIMNPVCVAEWFEKFKKKETWYNEEQTTERMNIIGQNGNDGTHY